MITKEDIVTFERVLDHIAQMTGIVFNEHDARWVKGHTVNILRWYKDMPMKNCEERATERCKCGHERSVHGYQTPWCLAEKCKCPTFQHHRLSILGDQQ